MPEQLNVGPVPVAAMPHLIEINQVIACARLLNKAVTMQQVVDAREMLAEALQRLDDLPPF